MTKFITQVKFNLWGIQKDINFYNGLNIISGSNGTGKTKLLQFIQQNSGNENIVLSDGTHSAILSAFSPQRNASKRAVAQAVQIFRTDVNAPENAISILKSVIPDDGYQDIKSISEYFVFSSQKKVETEDARLSESTVQIKQLYEDVIKKVFALGITFEYSNESRTYELFFIKEGDKLTPQQLSHGENAMIALMCALIYSKDSAETFLIDEPEIHLNWSLQEKLFEFFDWFCSTFERQIIVVTHARISFLEKYEGKRQFFERHGKDIIISEKPSEELTRQLAGDTVQLLQGITTKKKLVYVEDDSHRTVLAEICKKLGLEAEILISGNCEKVKTLSRAFKGVGIENVYFLLDGDNKPLTTDEKKELHKNTVQLEKYCIENYLLDANILNLYKTGFAQKLAKSIVSRSEFQL